MENPKTETTGSYKVRDQKEKQEDCNYCGYRSVQHRICKNSH